MLVEIKTNGRDLDDSQRDLLHIVNQLLRTTPWKDQRESGRFPVGHRQNVRNVYSSIARRRIQLLCYGVHKWRLSGSAPEDSEWMTWDDKPIETDQLVKLFRFDLSPDTLRAMEHRVHKRVVSRPTLFEPLS
jgi:hypothetical protein